TMRPRERAYALAAVVLVQLVLGFVLLTGLRVELTRSAGAVQRLIEIALPKPPPPPPPPPVRPAPKPAHRTSSAPKAAPKPRLGRAGIGGRVTVTFTVQVNGRATGCHVARSSRVPELDALTCRIIEQRFRFRPSTDRYGRPIADEVDWDHDWIPAQSRY